MLWLFINLKLLKAELPNIYKIIMHPTYQHILNLLEENFPNTRKINLIDYGCGNGLLLEYLSKEKLLKYLGLDISLDSISYAKNRYKFKKINFELIQQGKSINLGKPNSVDVIILIGVLQYMTQKEIKNFLNHAKKVLKSDGKIIISCAVDHVLYRIFNIYRLFLPNNFINKKIFLDLVRKSNMKVTYQQEKGIILSPLFSNVFSLFFDILDKILFQTKGSLGPIGKAAREVTNSILTLEYYLPINYGYTYFILLEKND